ncbi:MFS transporter [Halodurantibacterium flavum]|uniref:MFS transporter n=1 Tax=Halodurantibacterium flavum TaxID=1382802 RepID=A0ABW4RZK0_9RHOB
MNIDAQAANPGAPTASAWAAVFSMSLGVFGLVGAEFLPASLLTPIAADLGISEGMAGQAVTATAVMGVFASLTVASFTRSIDRRVVLLAFTLLLILSNFVVAAAQSFPVILLGRVLLGIALGGFWALSTALVMRLVLEADVPKALSIVIAGVSAATVFAAPLGSYVGDVLGWRAVFFGAGALGIITFVVQFLALPSLPSLGHANMGTIFRVVARPHVALGMIAVLLAFGGHMSMFIYVRPYLENVTSVGVTGITFALLAFGLANFAGNYLGGVLVARSLRATLAMMPLLIAAMAFLLVSIGQSYVATVVLIVIWGMAFGAIPVAWSTWISRAIADEAESGGGLLVASISFAIAAGAAIGGVILDLVGIQSVFIVNGIVLVLAAIVVATGVGASRTAPAPV